MLTDVYSEESDMEGAASPKPELNIDTKLPSDTVFDCTF
jgi:hypothetical protein